MYKKNNKKRQKGFTLLELLVSVTLMLVLVAAIVTIFNRSTEIFNISEANMNVLQNARVAFDTMSKDIISARNDADSPIVIQNPTNANPANPILAFQTSTNFAINYSIILVNDSNGRRWRLRRNATNLTDGSTTADQILCQFIHAPGQGATPVISFALGIFDDGSWAVTDEALPANQDANAIRLNMEVTDRQNRVVRTVSRMFWIAE